MPTTPAAHVSTAAIEDTPDTSQLIFTDWVATVPPPIRPPTTTMAAEPVVTSRVGPGPLSRSEYDVADVVSEAVMSVWSAVRWLIWFVAEVTKYPEAVVAFAGAHSSRLSRTKVLNWAAV